MTDNNPTIDDSSVSPPSPPKAKRGLWLLIGAVATVVLAGAGVWFFALSGYSAQVDEVPAGGEYVFDSGLDLCQAADVAFVEDEVPLFDLPRSGFEPGPETGTGEVGCNWMLDATVYKGGMSSLSLSAGAMMHADPDAAQEFFDSYEYGGPGAKPYELDGVTEQVNGWIIDKPHSKWMSASARNGNLTVSVILNVTGKDMLSTDTMAGLCIDMVNEVMAAAAK